MADELGQAVLKLALDTQELTVGLSAVERLVSQRIGKIQSNIAKVGKDFVIELQPTSISRLEKFIDATRVIETQLKRLKNTPISISDPGLGVLSKEYEDFARKAVNTGSNLGNTEVTLRNQIGALRALAANLKSVVPEYTNLTQAAAKAQQKLSFRQFDELSAVSELFKIGKIKFDDSFKGTEDLLAFGKNIKQTPASINLYVQALRQALAVTDIADPNFNRLTEAIIRQQRALDRASAAAERYAQANRPRIGFGGAPPVATGFTEFSRRATRITEQARADREQAAADERDARISATRERRLERIAILRRRRARGLAARRGIGGAISSGLVGGAFPLLFGQGIGAAVGGLTFGAGGGAASALGGPPGLGFGASLVGTILGQAFDNAIDKAKTLAAALDDPIGSFDALKQGALLSSRAVEKQAEALINAGRTAEAYALIQQDLASRFGDAESAKELLKTTDDLNRRWSELSTVIGILTAGPLEALATQLLGLLGPAGARLAFEQRVSQLTPEQQVEARQIREQELGKIGSFASAEDYRAAEVSSLALVNQRFGVSQKQEQLEQRITTSRDNQLRIDRTRLQLAKEEDRIISLKLQKRQLELEQDRAIKSLGNNAAQADVDKIELDTKVKILEIERQITEETRRRDEKQQKAAQDLLNLRLRNLKFLPEAEKQGLLREEIGPAITRARLQGIPLRSISEAREFRDFEVEQQRLRGEAGSQLINSNSQLNGTLQSTAEVVRVLTASMDSLQQKNWEVHVTIPGQNGTKAGIDAVSGLSS